MNKFGFSVAQALTFTKVVFPFSKLIEFYLGMSTIRWKQKIELNQIQSICFDSKLIWFGFQGL